MELIVMEHKRIVSQVNKSECDLQIVCKDGDVFYSKLLFYFVQPQFKCIFESHKDVDRDERIILIHPDLSVTEILNLYDDDDTPTLNSNQDLACSTVEEVSLVLPFNNNISSESAMSNASVIENAKESTTELFCEHCGMKFNSIKQLKAHKWTKHKTRPDVVFKCGECSSEFSHKYQLNKHLIMHSPPTFECHYCGKAFKRKNGLVEHFKRFHDDTISLFNCSECHMTFRTKSNLTRHMSTHKIIQFQCSECSAVFNRNDNYKRHLKTHS